MLPKFPPQESSSAGLSYHSRLLYAVLESIAAAPRLVLCGVSKASLSPYETALAPMGRVEKQHLRCPEARGQQESKTLP